jgi:hypothetical protein
MRETTALFPPPERGRACPRAATRGSTRKAGRVGVPLQTQNLRADGTPPGAGACHRAGQRPDPLGATLPFQVEGMSACSLMLISNTRRTKHDQGFNGSTLFAEVAVNLEVDVKRMRLDLSKSGFYPANRTRVARLELQCCVLVTHVLSLPAGYFGAVCERAKWSTRALQRKPRSFGARSDPDARHRTCAGLLTLIV